MNKIKEFIFKEKERFITAIVLIAGFLFIATINSFFIFWLALGALYLIAFYESLKLFKIQTNSLYIYAAMIWLLAFFMPTSLSLLFVVLIILATVLAYNQTMGLNNFFPFIYPTAGFLFILDLYKTHSISVIIWLLVIVATTDIGAYIIGKSIGKTKFSPTSPNKTLEGVGGGVLSAAVVGGIFGIAITNFFWSFVVALLVSIAAVFGDLFESYLKRQADVKDSGSLFPGHGGILDRLDGYLFASVIMFVLLYGVI